MENKNNLSNNILQDVNRLSRLTKVMAILFLLLIVFIFLIPIFSAHQAQAISNISEKKSNESKFINSIDEFKQLPFPDNEDGKMAAYGEQLIRETNKYLGPDAPLVASFTGNRLACASCHLNAGTKAYAAPYIGLSALFPVYSGRDGKVGTLEDRINGCFERSMNGQKLPIESTEMLAIVSYIKHLSTDVKIGKRIEGQGFVKIEIPNRKADLTHGKLVFQKQCVSCHQQNGNGLAKIPDNLAAGYVYPPLWGDDSFNDGAGMARVITAAKFIKGNMPLGVNPMEPILSDEEAFDVAAYINSFDRPIKSNKEQDYPKLSQKPKDAAYPPFADQIPLAQHKYGPFNF